MYYHCPLVILTPCVSQQLILILPHCISQQLMVYGWRGEISVNVTCRVAEEYAIGTGHVMARITEVQIAKVTRRNKVHVTNTTVQV